MAYNNPLLIARNLSVFVVEETTPGTLVYPSASDALELSEQPSFEQQQDISTVETIRSSRTQQDSIFNNYQYGTFSNFVIPARPSGTAGTSPTDGEKTLLKCALGSVTDDQTSTVDGIAASAITKANPGVITLASHGFQKGDKITIANCTETDYNGDHVVASVTSTTITTETDMSGFGAGAASDGDVTLNMVRFELAEELPYFSVWMLTETGPDSSGGAVIEAYSGCQINSFSCTVSKDGELKYTFAGDFQREYQGGSAPLSATAADSTSTLTFAATYDVDELFFVGMEVSVIDPAASAVLDSPVTVTVVNSGANTITVDTMSVTNGPLPVGAICQPVLPTPAITGDVIAQRTSVIYLGPSDTDYGQASGDLFETTYDILTMSGSVTLSQSLDKPLEKELNGTDYPTAQFIPSGLREINGDVIIKSRIDDQKYAQTLRNTPRRALGYSVGNTDGYIIDFYFPKVFMRVPTKSVTDSSRELNIGWNTVEPSLGTEREFMLVYR